MAQHAFDHGAQHDDQMHECQVFKLSGARQFQLVGSGDEEMKKITFSLLLLVFYFNQANAIPVGFDATIGTWNISATDNSGVTWDDSTLNFESQTAVGSSFRLEGYFYWIGSSGAFGRENFTGQLFSDNTLELIGFELVPPTSGIVAVSYFAVLEDSGTEIINGSWSGSGVPSDDWSATLQVAAVPEPGVIWLFSIGVISLMGSRHRKAKVEF